MFKRFEQYPIVMNFFVAVCVICYLIEVLLGGSQNTATLLKMGAMNNIAVVVQYQWWRLLTAQFLHMGIMHLVSNLVMIYYLGNILELTIGHTRFFFLYLLSGIGGNLFSLAFSSDTTISAGASTSLFGLLGASMLLYFIMPANPFARLLGKQSLVLVVINLALDLFLPFVDLWGHVGGLISGMLLILILGTRLKIKRSHKIIVLASVILLIIWLMALRRGMVISY